MLLHILKITVIILPVSFIFFNLPQIHHFISKYEDVK